MKLTQEQLNEYVLGLESNGQKEVFDTLDIDDIDCVFNYGCSCGVGGFIYYNETESFFDRHSTEILELVEELKSEYGADFLGNIELTKNNLTWLFVEETVRQMVYALDCE